VQVLRVEEFGIEVERKVDADRGVVGSGVHAGCNPRGVVGLLGSGICGGGLPIGFVLTHRIRIVYVTAISDATASGLNYLEPVFTRKRSLGHDRPTEIIFYAIETGRIFQKYAWDKGIRYLDVVGTVLKSLV